MKIWLRTWNKLLGRSFMLKFGGRR